MTFALLYWKQIAAFVALAFAIWWIRDQGVQAERAIWVAKVAKMEAENAEESQRRIDEHTKAKEQAEDERKKLAAQKAIAVAAAAGMRNQLECARDPACNPAAGTGSKAVTAFADVFGECQSRRIEVAEAADRSWIAGSLCEKSYDSLTARQTIRATVRGK